MDDSQNAYNFFMYELNTKDVEVQYNKHMIHDEHINLEGIVPSIIKRMIQ